MSNHNPNSEEVAEFYNEYAEKQKRTGLNLRHYKSFTKIKKSGLKRNHNILEIGCGIGTFSKLLSSYCKNGTILCTDISPINIKEAKDFLKKRKNVSFEVTDMINFESDSKFDYIVLLDVLEHIPIDQHPALFNTFSKLLSTDGTIFINIPHHNYLDYIRINKPEKLQIIDQSLTMDVLSSNIYQANLRIVKAESHSLFHYENDYQRIIIRHNSELITISSIPKIKIIISKAYHRLKSLINF